MKDILLCEEGYTKNSYFAYQGQYLRKPYYVDNSRRNGSVVDNKQRGTDEGEQNAVHRDYGHSNR